MKPHDSTVIDQTPPAALARTGPAAPAGPLTVAGVSVVGMITTVEAIAREIAELSKVANVISPFTRPSHLAPGFAVTVAVIQIDPTVDERTGNGPEVYRAGFMKPHERAFNRIALRRISAGLGIDWLPFPHCRRVDDNSKQNYAEFTVKGAYRTFDGSVLPVRGTAACDFREGSEQIGGWSARLWADLMARNKAAMAKGVKKEACEWTINHWSESRVRQARAKVLERAETLAQNRGIRDIGLKHVYTLDELKKPFVCFRMTFVPDMSDPEIKRIVTLNALAGVAMLYPTGMPMLPSAGASSDVIDVTPAAAGSVDATPPSVSSPVPGPPPPPADPPMDTITQPVEPVEPPREARTIVQAGPLGNSPGWALVLNGGEFMRVDEDVCKTAAKAKREGQRVYVTTEMRLRPEGKVEDRWVLELTIAVPAPPAAGNPALPADAEFIVSVEEFAGEKNGRTWKRRKITTESGAVWSTFDDTDASTAVLARDQHLPVRATTEVNPKYEGQLDLKALRVLDGSEPDLPFDGDESERY